MRITRERLLTLALEETQRRAEHEAVLSGYVIGSLVSGDPLLGGTADIDLVLIHDEQPPVERELVPLSSQIHLDIAHRPRSFYQQPRQLRRHPWYGPEICEPGFLYDPTHFFEWAQAAVRGQFHRLDFVYARAQAFLRRARRFAAAARSDADWLPGYLNGLLETVNSVASLTGFPAAGRQVGAQLAAKLGELDNASLFQRFQQLLGADQLPQWDLPDWVAAWARAYDQALTTRQAPNPATEGRARSGSASLLVRERREYYLAGFQTMIEDGRASLILWPLLNNWARLRYGNGTQALGWEPLLEQLRLSDRFADHRLAALERLQDEVEGQLERWSERVGA